jgi:hypothetical protein
MKAPSIPKGSAVMLGRPAQPMPQALSEAIGGIVRGIAGIREAYLPQCYLAAVVEPPAQILVLVLDNTTDPRNVLDAVGQALNRVLPQGTHLDVWPMTDRNSLLSIVRGTRTHIHCEPPQEKRPWWNIFR